jgi:hypothetical protein
MTRRTGGALRINAAFRDENMALISTRNIGIVANVDPDGDGEVVSALIGPSGSRSDIELPANVAFIVISFVNTAFVGGATEPRNMRYLRISAPRKTKTPRSHTPITLTAGS